MSQRKFNTLYVSDLDGTLLNEKSRISALTARTLNRLIDNGICFTIATARTPATVVKLMNEVRLNLPVVLMTGVEQIIQSVHFRFDRCSHGSNDFFRSGTRISCCNKNGWLFSAHTPAQNADPEDCRCKQKQPFHTVSFRSIDNCSKSFSHTIVPHDEKIK